MPNLSEKFYEETKNTKTHQYIETGSYQGDGIARVLPNYTQIHSIELSEVWYEHCVNRFKDSDTVKMYLGNSKYILSNILKDINEPATVYLDGHFSAGTTAFGEETLNGVSSNPLLSELAVLMTRDYNDIIIIDDCRMIGKKGREGDGSTEWPFYDYDWTNITEAKVRAILKPGYILVKNPGYSDGAPDQWILAFDYN
jgi:hypothetical protein